MRKIAGNFCLGFIFLEENSLYPLKFEVFNQCLKIYNVSLNISKNCNQHHLLLIAV